MIRWASLANVVGIPSADLLRGVDLQSDLDDFSQQLDRGRAVVGYSSDD